MIKVEKTGRHYSLASNEYLVTFPDGQTLKLWSPPWNELSDFEEARLAIEKANEIWKTTKKS